MPRWTPSWKQGFARNAAESDNPGLWVGLRGLWVPALGPTGLILRDVGGYGHGTLTNMTAAAWVTGAPTGGYALAFTAASSQCVLTSVLRVSAYPFTVMGWAHRPTSGDLYGTLAGIGSTTNESRNYAVALYNGNCAIRLRGPDGSVTFEGGAMAVGEWSHVACVCHSATLRELFLNGVSQGTNATNVSYDAANCDRFGIGAYVDSSISTYWNGRIGDVGLYSRAITPSEIQHLCGQPLAPLQPRRRVYPAAVGGAPPATLAFFPYHSRLNRALDNSLIGR